MRTIMERIFGSSARIKVIDYLIELREFDFNARDISEGTGLSRPSAYANVNALQKYGIVKKGRMLSGIQMYTLNKNTQLGKVLLALNEGILKYQEAQIEKDAMVK